MVSDISRTASAACQMWEAASDHSHRYPWHGGACAHTGMNQGKVTISKHQLAQQVSSLSWSCRSFDKSWTRMAWKQGQQTHGTGEHLAPTHQMDPLANFTHRKLRQRGRCQSAEIGTLLENMLKVALSPCSTLGAALICRPKLIAKGSILFSRLSEAIHIHLESRGSRFAVPTAT